MDYRRPTFSEIKEAISRTFPIPGNRDFALTPDSIANYFASDGIKLPWDRVSNWIENDYGRRGFTDQEFMEVLFQPLAPKPRGIVYAITDECFWEGKQLGFALPFQDLLSFAQQVYPTIMPRPMDFFQPSDTIFLAEESRLLILLHHEGHRVQFSK